MSKLVGKNCGNCNSCILSSKRGITPTQIDGNWQHSNLTWSTVKQSFMSHFSAIWDNCGKLCISSILSSKRGISLTKIDGYWRQSNLIECSWEESDMQNFSSICQSMLEKMRKTDWRTETRTDVNHHTIIRPVWRRVYKKWKNKQNSFPHQVSTEHNHVAYTIWMN